MSDLNFDKILELLKRIHDKYPDLRFGQVLQTAADKAKGIHNTDLHDLNSKKIIEALESFDTQIEHAIKSGRHNHAKRNNA